MPSSTHQQAFDATYREHPLARSIRAGDVDSEGIPYRSELHREVWWHATQNIWRLLEIDRGGLTILNVGAGFGLDEKALVTRHDDLELWGVDISAEMIGHALANECVSSLAVSSAEELPLPDNSFDRVFSREVIEHVEDVDSYCDEVARVARDEAIVVVTTPNARSLALVHLVDRLGLEDLVTAPVDYKDDHLTPEEIEAALERTGMIVIETFYDCPGWFWLLDLDRTPARRITRGLARWLFPLSGTGRLARLLCDQVKIKAVVSKAGASNGDPHWTCGECCGELVESRCVDCSAVQPCLQDGVPQYVTSEPVPTPDPTTTLPQLARFRFVFVLHTLWYAPLLLATRLGRVCRRRRWPGLRSR